MSLDCGRKPEYPVRTHACMGRTCKLHAERPLAGNRTQDLLAARQQCYQLHHRAAQFAKQWSQFVSGCAFSAVLVFLPLSELNLLIKKIFTVSSSPKCVT
ncbi:hypothetical protein ILYODFUR_019034 [Ilyodon furcidens]|uniref:Uncharacterized protein n=1 Tax=Ilyodon furcidens TaxID=33524 RepID=A0ABV0TX06_9TELE